MILQLDPPIPMVTDKGSGYANFLIDRGMEFENEWVIFLDNGEIWSVLNSKVRLCKNITYGRKLDNNDEIREIIPPPEPTSNQYYCGQCLHTYKNCNCK